MQHYFHKSFCLSLLPWNPFWSYAIHPQYLAADHFAHTNVHLARRMRRTWFCLTFPSQTNWAKIPAVNDGKANQFSRMQRIMQSKKSCCSEHNILQRTAHLLLVSSSPFSSCLSLFFFFLTCCCLPLACCEGSVQGTVDFVAWSITSGLPESSVIFTFVLGEGFRPALLNHSPQLNVLRKALYACMW